MSPSGKTISLWLLHLILFASFAAIADVEETAQGGGEVKAVIQNSAGNQKMAVLREDAAQLAGANPARASGNSQSNAPEPQPPPPSKSEPATLPSELKGVTVTGHAQYSKHQLEETIIPEFIRTHGTFTRIGQFSRWRLDVCPTTEGLPSSSNQFVSARLREIAAEVGAPTAEPCKQNVEIVFTNNPQQILDDISRHHQWALGFHYASQATQLATVRYPIQAWYVTATRRGIGLPLVDSEFGGYGGVTPSVFSQGLSSEFLHVLVVVDLNKVGGHEIGLIADYVAMLALSNPSLEDCSELPSVLDLWSSACGNRTKPATLTSADIAYLKALYDINMEYNGSFERFESSNRMRRDIDGH